MINWFQSYQRIANSEKNDKSLMMSSFQYH